jgi:hypothetical protein
MTRPLLLLTCFFLTTAAGAATLNNDDSCDIAVMPAATLLLPYFEVDLDNAGRTTLFSVTNVTNVDRIARVTLWTDRSHPVFAFNLYLTGYDVQTISLYDVIANGVIGNASGSGTNVTPRRRFSDPNPGLDLSACAVLPGGLDAASIPYMQTALTEGKVDACTTAGGVHELAVGYATIDVVRACTANLPTERNYWTEDIAFDNVLIGEFHQVDAPNNFAQGEPMVHIRAIPEGGGASAGFPRTFYGRYVPSDLPKGLDGRQPLPSLFAARWIHGGPSQFQTSLKIWREGTSGAGASCADYTAQRNLEFKEMVRFDEAENSVAEVPVSGWPPPPPVLPPSSLVSVADLRVFVQLPNGATAGWFYFNFDNCTGPNCAPGHDASQNWVVVSMRAEGRYSTDTPAVMLGNGCSRSTPASEIGRGNHVIAPAPNVRQ